MLPPTSLKLHSGGLLVALGDPGHAHTALALALCGRLVPDQGGVEVDGDGRAKTLQGSVTVVDVPGVSDPDDVVPTTTIVGEELAMAKRKAGRGHVDTWLRDHHLSHVHASRIEDLSPCDRVTLLTSLAALRGAPFLVLTLPDRHGGLPDLWLPHLSELAESGLGVLVSASTSVAPHIPAGISTLTFGDTQEDLG